MAYFTLDPDGVNYEVPPLRLKPGKRYVFWFSTGASAGKMMVSESPDGGYLPFSADLGGPPLEFDLAVSGSGRIEFVAVTESLYFSVGSGSVASAGEVVQYGLTRVI